MGFPIHDPQLQIVGYCRATRNWSDSHNSFLYFIYSISKNPSTHIPKLTSGCFNKIEYLPVSIPNSVYLNISTFHWKWNTTWLTCTFFLDHHHQPRMNQSYNPTIYLLHCFFVQWWLSTFHKPEASVVKRFTFGFTCLLNYTTNALFITNFWFGHLKFLTCHQARLLNARLLLCSLRPSVSCPKKLKQHFSCSAFNKMDRWGCIYIQSH